MGIEGRSNLVAVKWLLERWLISKFLGWMVNVRVYRYTNDKMRDKKFFDQNVPFTSSVTSEKMKPRSWPHHGPWHPQPCGWPPASCLAWLWQLFSSGGVKERCRSHMPCRITVEGSRGFNFWVSRWSRQLWVSQWGMVIWETAVEFVLFHKTEQIHENVQAQPIFTLCLYLSYC